MKGMGADGIAHVVHTDPTLIEAHCNSSSMQITGFARREQQKDRRWFKKIKDMSDIFAWKAPRDLNCPPDWTPIIHFTMAHQVVDAIATWHDDNVPSDQFPTHRMYYIPLSDKLRQQWHDLDKIHHFSHGKEEQLDNMTVGVTPQTILNLIHVSQQRQGRAVYCDGTFNLTVLENIMLILNAQICGPIVGNLNSFCRSSAAPLAFCNCQAESNACVVMLLLVLKDFICNFCGIELDIQISGSDHADCFITAMRVVFPLSKQYQCYTHILSQLMPGRSLYLKIINRATFVDIAMRNIKWLHLTHSAMAHAKAADAMLLAWTVIHGEGVAADHFRTYYLDDRYTLWYYKCLGIPGK
jgi:hypothetical protein